MKPRIALTLFAVLCIGVFIGRAGSPSGRSERQSDDGAEDGRSSGRFADRASTPVANTPFARFRKEIRSASPGDCGKLLRKALETPDPFERRALVDELMARMDASNYFEMSTAAAQVTRETGRPLHEEWLLIHSRAGQVAGLEAMGHYVEQNALGSKPAERTMWGWATQDPEGARQWLDGNPDVPESVREALFSTIMNGAIVNDPQRAILLLESLPDEKRVEKTDSFVGAFVQHLGKDRAIEWLASVSASDAESEYGKGLARSVFDKAMWAGANQKNAKVMVADLERLASIMPLDAKWINRGMGQIRDRKVTGGIELLDQIARSPTLSRIPLGEREWWSAVGDAMERDPEAVARWLSENTDSPIHAEVSSRVEKAN